LEMQGSGVAYSPLPDGGLLSILHWRCADRRTVDKATSRNADFQYSIGDAYFHTTDGWRVFTQDFQYSIGDADSPVEGRSRRRDCLSILHWRCYREIQHSKEPCLEVLSILHWRCKLTAVDMLRRCRDFQYSIGDAA